MDKPMNASIRDVLKKYENAVWEKDLDAFLDLYDQTIIDYDVWDQWEYYGIADFRKMPEKWFGESFTERVKVSFLYPKIHHSGNLAALWSQVVYAVYDAAGENLRSITNRMTMVLEFKMGRWYIIHEHTSVPVKKPVSES